MHFSNFQLPILAISCMKDSAVTSGIEMSSSPFCEHVLQSSSGDDKSCTQDIRTSDCSCFSTSHCTKLIRDLHFGTTTWKIAFVSTNFVVHLNNTSTTATSQLGFEFRPSPSYTESLQLATKKRTHMRLRPFECRPRYQTHQEVQQDKAAKITQLR